MQTLWPPALGAKGAAGIMSGIKQRLLRGPVMPREEFLAWVALDEAARAQPDPTPALRAALAALDRARARDPEKNA